MINFNQISALFIVFQKGKSVANPAAWKTGQITVTALAPFIIALVGVGEVFGYKLPISNEQVITIAGAIVAIVNIVCTITTSEKIGLGKGTSMSSSNLDNLESDGFGTEHGVAISNTQESTRASLGYERVGNPSATDRAGG